MKGGGVGGGRAGRAPPVAGELKHLVGVLKGSRGRHRGGSSSGRRRSPGPGPSPATAAAATALVLRVALARLGTFPGPGRGLGAAPPGRVTAAALVLRTDARLAPRLGLGDAQGRARCLKIEAGRWRRVQGHACVQG